MEKYGVIYKITNDINGKVYIGQTKRGFDKRYQASGSDAERVYKYHKRLKEHNRNYNVHLFNAMEKYGWENFSVEKEFDIAETKEELDKLEIKYISEYSSDVNGYNSESGGHQGKPNKESRKRMAKFGEKNGFFGKNHSAETREYLSTVRKGKYKGSENPNYGNRWSEEQKRALSEKKKGVPSPNKGRKMPMEFCIKNSISHKGLLVGEKHPRYGKHWDEAHKQAQSDRMRGRYTGSENSNAKTVVCVTTGECFKTINDGAEKYGISPTGISACLHGKRAHAGKTKDNIPLEWKFKAAN